VDVQTILTEALKAIENANVPTELRVVAFGKAVDLVAGRDPHATRPRVLPSGTPLVGEAPLSRLATRLKLDVVVLADVYHDSGTELELVVSPQKLSTAKSKATKEIALLVAAARQSQGEEWSYTDVIRKTAEDYKRYDSPNFASALSEMKSEFNVRGSARKRELKLTRPGWEAAAALVTGLVDSSS